MTEPQPLPFQRNGQPPSNASLWSVESEGYDPSNFYTASTDGKGVTASIRINVPPAVSAEISAMIQSGKVGDYRTAADFWRDAGTHRLHWLAAYMKDPRLNNFVSMQMRLAERERQMHEMEDLEVYLQRTEELLSKARRRGDMDMVSQVVEENRKMAEGIREPYRGMIRKVFAGYGEEGGK